MTDGTIQLTVYSTITAAAHILWVFNSVFLLLWERNSKTQPQLRHEKINEYKI